MKGDIGISETGMALAIALGAIAPIVVNRSIELAGTTKDVPFLAVSAMVFGVVGTLSTYLIRTPLSVVAVLVYGGIAIGMVADSAIDQFAFSRAQSTTSGNRRNVDHRANSRRCGIVARGADAWKCCCLTTRSSRP